MYSGTGTGMKQVRITPLASFANDNHQVHRSADRGSRINRPSTPFNRMDDDSSDEEERQSGVGGETRWSSESVGGGKGHGKGERKKKRKRKKANTKSVPSGIADQTTRIARIQRSNSSIRSHDGSVSSIDSCESRSTIRASTTMVGSVVGGGETPATESEDEDGNFSSRGVHQAGHQVVTPGKSSLRTPKVYHPTPTSIVTNLPTGAGGRDNWKPLPPSPKNDCASVTDLSFSSFSPRGLFSMGSLRRQLPLSSSSERPPSFKEPMKRRASDTFNGGFSPSSGSSWSRSGGGIPPLIYPAEDLYAYLRGALIPKWTKWIDPDLVRGDESRFGPHHPLFWSKRRSRGGPSRTGDAREGRAAVINRLIDDLIKNDEENGNPERELKSWEPRRGFYEMMKNVSIPRLRNTYDRKAFAQNRNTDIEKNVPPYPIEESNRWGDQ